MMGQRDPLVLLRAANPVRNAEIAGLASSEAAVDLLHRIILEPVPGQTSGLRRRRRLVPMLAALSLCGGAVAYAVVNRPVSKPQYASCFATADVHAVAQVVIPGGRRPAAACADLWVRGAFGDPATPVLAECVLDSGTVGVFPVVAGADPCAALKLSPVPGPTPNPDPGPSGTAPSPAANADDAFGAFEKAALDRFLASPCVGPAEGRAVVREELDRGGLKDWTVQDSAPFTADRPCATLAFNSPGHQVLLVPAPRR
ncbi:MAG: hypothetical protein M3066_11685 [Actinomycetota bacterium]|nr:hypothetical protein [Actinomycetota bacterium]